MPRNTFNGIYDGYYGDPTLGILMMLAAYQGAIALKPDLALAHRNPFLKIPETFKSLY